MITDITYNECTFTYKDYIFEFENSDEMMNFIQTTTNDDLDMVIENDEANNSNTSATA